MRFGLVNATESTVQTSEFEDLQAAAKALGLRMGAVDFGGLTPNLNLIVYEFGLFVDPDAQRFFAVGMQLYAGNAVIFQTNDAGDTVDLSEPLPLIRFFPTAKDVEQAISAGQIRRPQTAVNGQVTWQWNAKSGQT